MSFPNGSAVKNLQCRSRRRCKFDPWVRKIPWRRSWKPTPVFLPGEAHWHRSLATVHRVTKSWTQLERFSVQHVIIKSHGLIFNLFLIGGQLLYNTVLASAVQHESATYLHMSPTSWTFSHSSTPSYPCRLSLSTSLSSLCYSCLYTCGSNLPIAIYFTYSNVYVSVLLSQFTTRSLLSPLCPKSASLFLPCK